MPYPLSQGVGKGWPAASALQGVQATVTFAMDQLPSANKVYQRATTTGGGQSKGQGTISVPATVSATTAIYARCRSAADGTTILQAAFQAIASASAGSVPLPIAGIDARLGWFFVDLAPSASGPWQLGTVPVGMGAITFMGAAQSLGVRMFKNINNTPGTITGNGVTINPNGSCFASWGDPVVSPPATTVWALPSDTGTYNSAGGAKYLDLMVQRLGVNHAFCGCPVNGVQASYFINGNGGATQLAAILTEIGGYEYYLSYIGHNDATAGTHSVIMRTTLTHVAEACAAKNSRGKNFRTIVMSLPNDNAYTTASKMDIIRKALYEWATLDMPDICTSGGTYANSYSVQLSDNVHPTQIGTITVASALVASLDGNYTADTSLTGDPAVGASILNGPAAYSAGKFLPQALSTGSVYVGDGTQAGLDGTAGTSTRSMWVYLTAYPGTTVLLFGGNLGLNMTTTGGTTGSYAAPAGSYPLNRWFFLTLETSNQLRSPSGALLYNRVYVDGVKVAESAAGNTATDTFNCTGALGAKSATGGGNLVPNCVISEVATWNKALGSYVPTAALTGTEPRLTAYAPLNGSIVGVR